MSEAQNFKNHARTVPAFHYVVLPILLINLVWSIYSAVHVFSGQTMDSVLLAIALILFALNARLFALRVQDRVIRMEMQLRMRQILPADLMPRIPEFTVSQLVALRFASDAELPDLARKVLQENLTERRVIKAMIRNWQPDNLRA
jgi:hypothetical protein